MLLKQYMFQNEICAQSVSLLQNREMFENEIKNRQKNEIYPLRKV